MLVDHDLFFIVLWLFTLISEFADKNELISILSDKNRVLVSNLEELVDLMEDHRVDLLEQICDNHAQISETSNDGRVREGNVVYLTNEMIEALSQSSTQTVILVRVVPTIVGIQRHESRLTTPCGSECAVKLLYIRLTGSILQLALTS
jgi:hypothetical protein